MLVRLSTLAGSSTTVVRPAAARAKEVSHSLPTGYLGNILKLCIGEADTVFVLEDGATLKNVIIGADQKEGVYCLGSCNLEFVWFEKVCEDAISIKGSGTANIIGGGAYGADDKVIQHNGCGHVNVINFYANDYGKVYRSCGNCKGNCARTVHMEGVTAIGGGELMGINTNMGDKVNIDPLVSMSPT